MSDGPVQAMPEEAEKALPERCREVLRQDGDALESLTDQIAVFDTQSIITFGAEAEAELGRSADTILKSIRSEKLSDPGPVLSTLGRLMEQMDVGEIAEAERPRKGWRPFRPAPKSPEQVLEKYRAMTADIDRAYIALKQYEAELRTYDGHLEAVYRANLRFYEDLVRHILAGERGLEEIRGYLTAGRVAQEDRDTVERSYALLERRVQDLRLSEAAALQTLPMVQTIRRNNLQLIQNINTAFLTTLPIFRQILTQAMARKRQRLQAQAMEALDRRTREALGGIGPRSGQGAADSGGTQAEALEQARETILRGIQEARALRQTGDACRAEAGPR